MTEPNEDRPDPGEGIAHSDARRSQGWTAGPEDRDPTDRMQTEPADRRADEADDQEQRPPHEP
jgi:hypothetical protein